MRSVEGDLESIGIPELFRAIANDNRTGCLTIHKEGSEARVYFRKGMVYQAKILGTGVRLGIRLVSAGAISPADLEKALAMQRAEGGKRRLGDLLAAEGMVERETIQTVMKSQVEDTIFEMMKWESSPFAFDEGVKSDDDLGLTLPVGKLILDSARRFRDWHKIVRRIPSLAAVAQVTDEPMSLELVPEQKAVLERVDGVATASQIAYACGFTDFEVAKVIDDLAEMGLIEITLPPGVEPPMEDPEVEEAFKELEHALEEAYRNVAPGTSLEELVTPEGSPPPAPLPGDPDAAPDAAPVDEMQIPPDGEVAPHLDPAMAVAVPVATPDAAPAAPAAPAAHEEEAARVIAQEAGPDPIDETGEINVSRLFAEVTVADQDEKPPMPAMVPADEDDDEPPPVEVEAASEPAKVDPSVDTSALLREFSGLGLGEEESPDQRGRSGRKRR